MNAARLERSERLKRVYDLMSDGRERSTMDIIIGANVCAVNSIASELRRNGSMIDCKRRGNAWFYKMKTGKTL